jgi:hypothetical protein
MKYIMPARTRVDYEFNAALRAWRWQNNVPLEDSASGQLFWVLTKGNACLWGVLYLLGSLGNGEFADPWFIFCVPFLFLMIPILIIVGGFALANVMVRSIG